MCPTCVMATRPYSWRTPSTCGVAATTQWGPATCCMPSISVSTAAPRPLPPAPRAKVQVPGTSGVRGQGCFAHGCEVMSSLGGCNLLCLTETHRWFTPKTSGAVPGARDGHSACVLLKSMYIFGGYEQLVGLHTSLLSQAVEGSSTWAHFCVPAVFVGRLLLQ